MVSASSFGTLRPNQYAIPRLRCAQTSLTSARSTEVEDSVKGFLAGRRCRVSSLLYSHQALGLCSGTLFVQ